MIHDVGSARSNAIIEKAPIEHRRAKARSSEAVFDFDAVVPCQGKNACFLSASS